jgi:hypothetical protein
MLLEWKLFTRLIDAKEKKEFFVNMHANSCNLKRKEKYIYNKTFTHGRVI